MRRSVSPRRRSRSPPSARAATKGKKAEIKRLAALVDAAVNERASRGAVNVTLSITQEQQALAQCVDLARQHAVVGSELLDELVEAHGAPGNEMRLIFTFYVSLLPPDGIAVQGMSVELYRTTGDNRGSTWSHGRPESGDEGQASVEFSHVRRVGLSFAAGVLHDEVDKEGYTYTLPKPGALLARRDATRVLLGEHYVVYDDAPGLDDPFAVLREDSEQRLSELDVRLIDAWLGFHDAQYLRERFGLVAASLPRLLTSEAEIVEAAAHGISTGGSRYGVFSLSSADSRELSLERVSEGLDEAGERYGYVFGELIEADDGFGFAKEYLSNYRRVVLFEGQSSYETRELAVRALTRVLLQVVGGKSTASGASRR